MIHLCRLSSSHLWHYNNPNILDLSIAVVLLQVVLMAEIHTRCTEFVTAKFNKINQVAYITYTVGYHYTKLSNFIIESMFYTCLLLTNSMFT